MFHPAGRIRRPAAKPGWLGVFLLLWPILVAALDPSRAITQYRPDQWTRRDGLPQMSVLCMLQDRTGYLWLGLQEGLARFDGVSFRTFNVEGTPALANNYISALFEDRRGRIWIGTETGDLSYFDGAALVAAPGGNVLRGLVVGFAESPGGDLFVAFRGAGLLRFTGDQWEPVVDQDGRPTGHLGSFAQGWNGEIWAGGEGRLFRFAGGRWTRFDLPYARGRLVTALAVDASGEVVLSEDGPAVVRLHPNGPALEPVQPGWDLPSPVRSLLFDRDRTLWIATESGVARRRAAPGAGVEPWAGGPGSSINTFFEDREGGLWIGTNAEGLLRLRADEVVPLGAAEGLPHDTTWNVMEASDGALWVTTNGGLARIDGERIEHVSVPGLPGADAVALAERRDGSIWVGTYRYGLFRLSGHRGPAVRFTHGDGVPGGPITVIFEDLRGRLWVGSREGLAIESGERFQAVRLVEGDVQPYVAAIVEGREGTVWIATNAGLFALGPGGMRRYGSRDGLAGTAINGLLLDREGRLWTATNGQGLQVFDGGRFLTVDRRHGLPTGTLTWIVEDDLGGLWFSSNQGLFRADRQSLLRAARGGAKPVELRRFGLGDGMLNEECAGTGQPSATRARDGRVWFATGTGLVSVDPARLTPPVPPPPALEALVVGGRALPLPSAAPIDLTPGQGDIEIRFTALGLDEAAGTRFRYRLNGYDDAWIEAGGRRSAFYTGLPPGSYGFDVQALHDDGGAWSAPVSLSFRQLPHVYETAWFRSLLAAAAGLALYGGVRWRSRNLERRAAELSLANQGLAEAVRRAELAHREAEHHAEEARRAANAKGAFLATVSHELRTPLNGIFGCSELLLGSALDPRQREFAGIIRTSGETLLSLVNQILDLSQSDRGKLTLDSERFWVPGCFEEAVELVGNAAEAKGLDLALSIGPAAHRYAIGDRTRLREIATNLLANAVKFTGSGGVLADVRARIGEDGLHLELEVSDTGIGIAPEDHLRIFQPFEQVDASLTRRYGGSGLGLAIASRLCGWMQGTLSVESELGKGSAFTATVRLDLDPASAGSPEGIRLNGRRVLLAVLSGQTLAAVERQLLSWGAAVSSSEWMAGESGEAFAFGIFAERGGTSPGLAIPWIRLVSPNLVPAPASEGVHLLRPVRPSRLEEAILKVLASPAPTQHAESPVRKEVSADSPAILIVDDDPVSRQLLQAVLNSLGCASDLATSGEAALEALDARCYDLLLLDIQMPGMDGYELARRVRVRFGRQGPPRLVALTASAMEGDRERCLAAGMDDYLSKPMRRQELADVVAACGMSRKGALLISKEIL
jgi:signal transduction histidine kinase/ligand-binding sensor domain-containing protein/ActR/RegA family two-component response regulator